MQDCTGSNQKIPATIPATVWKQVWIGLLTHIWDSEPASTWPRGTSVRVVPSLRFPGPRLRISKVFDQVQRAGFQTGLDQLAQCRRLLRIWRRPARSAAAVAMPSLVDSEFSRRPNGCKCRSKTPQTCRLKNPHLWHLVTSQFKCRRCRSAPRGRSDEYRGS